MRTTKTIPAFVIACSLAVPLLAQENPTTPNPNAPGAGERLGERIDRGVQQLSTKIQQGWADIRKSVDELGIQGRVYGRLHWDKALAAASIDIQIQNENVIVLTGAVPDEASRLKAATLAADTIGVQNVVNQLTIAPLPPRP